MDQKYFNNTFEPKIFIKSKQPAVKWFKKWVPQDVVAMGGKCFVKKWVTEAQSNAMDLKEPEAAVKPKLKHEPTTEVLFLCSYEGCGKTFIDAGAIRKHSQIHGEKQFVCRYQNCGKRFLDNSKLKRHFLIHAGEKDYVCPHVGCGKAFSLDFNLRSHMKTHSQENYHMCPYPLCGKRYTHEYKLKKHVISQHDTTNDDMMVETALKHIHVPPVEKASSKSTQSSTSNRRHACPYKGCEKAYIHRYKLNLHLKRKHHKIFKNTHGSKMDARSEHDGRTIKRVKYEGKIVPKPNVKVKSAKIIQCRTQTVVPVPVPVITSVIKKQCGPYEEDEEDSEETEEDCDKKNRRGYRDINNNDEDDDDDEETEYED